MRPLDSPIPFRRAAISCVSRILRSVVAQAVVVVARPDLEALVVVVGEEAVGVPMVSTSPVLSRVVVEALVEAVDMDVARVVEAPRLSRRPLRARPDLGRTNNE
jgi:hypothetical protein